MTAASLRRDQGDRHPPNAAIVDGSRWYTHPRTGERWVSVTSALEIVAKPKIPFWSAGLAAEAAFDRLPMLVKAARRRSCGKGPRSDDACQRCRECVQWWVESRHIAEKDEAADRGSRIHHVAEHFALTGEIRPHDDDIAEYVKQYLRFVAEFKVTYDASEMTVISRQYGYAGTLDGIIRCGWLPPKHKEWIGRPLLMDVKSGKSIWNESALQLNAYQNADAVMLPNGDETPLPAVDGLVTVHVRPDNYHVRPMDREPETFGAFLSALSLWRWQDAHGGEGGKGAVGRSMSKPRQPKQADAAPAPVPPRPVAPEPAKPARPAKRQSAVRRVNPFSVVGAPGPDDDIPF